jgi:hypothetical protein
MSPHYAELLLLQRQGLHAEARALLEQVMARPVAGGDVLYRDLIAAQIQRLRMETGGEPGPTRH